MNRTWTFNPLCAVFLKATLLWGIALYPSAAFAGRDAEVQHLLEYIEASGCTFHRNGKSHDSRTASEHIRRKYGHTKQWIKSAEDFIRYAATKSSVSGRPYQVTCSDTRMPTAQWLSNELSRFRNSAR